MVIKLTPELQAALNQLALLQGITPENLALDVLNERFLSTANAALHPRDDWERGLLAAAQPSGISLPDVAFASDGLYD